MFGKYGERDIVAGSAFRLITVPVSEDRNYYFVVIAPPGVSLSPKLPVVGPYITQREALRGAGQAVWMAIGALNKPALPSQNEALSLDEAKVQLAWAPWSCQLVFDLHVPYDEITDRFARTAEGHSPEFAEFLQTLRFEWPDTEQDGFTVVKFEFLHDKAQAKGPKRTEDNTSASVFALRATFKVEYLYQGEGNPLLWPKDFQIKAFSNWHEGVAYCGTLLT